MIVGLRLKIARVEGDFYGGISSKTILGGGRLGRLPITFQVGHQLAVGGVKEPGVFAGEHQGDPGSIWADAYGADGAAGADLANHLEAVGVPMPNGAVIGPGNKLCRRGGHGGQRGDRTGMALKFAGGFQLVGDIVHCDQVILLSHSELLAVG